MIDRFKLSENRHKDDRKVIPENEAKCEHLTRLRNVTDLWRFDSSCWRSARRGLRSHVGAESLIRYLHAFLQGLQESGACGLYHVSRVNTCLEMVHKQSHKKQ